MNQLENADSQPFSFTGTASPGHGVLLLHGFTGSPFEVRLLGEYLAARGYAVEAPLLAGHGSDTRALAATAWPDWYASAEAALARLRARSERVAVCGLSMGGLLTLELARAHGDALAAIAVLSAPLWLPPTARAAAWLARRLPPVAAIGIPKIAGSDIRDPEMLRRNRVATGRTGISLGALASLIDLGERVRAHLGEVRVPALVAHARGDHTVPFACLDALAAGLGTRSVTRLVLEQSYHVVTLDVERERVFTAVGDHFARHLR